MGKFGWHSGKLKAKRIKLGDSYVRSSETFNHWDIYISGVGGEFLSGISPFTRAPTFTSSIFVGTAPSTPSYAFVMDEVDRCVGIQTVTPSNVERNTKLDMNIYWTCSAATMASGNQVAWDVDYRFVEAVTSGAYTRFVSGVNFMTSGVVNNATANGTYVFNPYGLPTTSHYNSGVVIKTTVSIPAFWVRPNAILQAEIYRDIYETTNNDLHAPAHLLFIVLEYRDEPGSRIV